MTITIFLLLVLAIMIGRTLADLMYICIQYALIKYQTRRLKDLFTRAAASLKEPFSETDDNDDDNIGNKQVH